MHQQPGPRARVVAALLFPWSLLMNRMRWMIQPGFKWYSKLDGNVYFGGLPSGRDIYVLNRRHGVQAVVNCCQEFPGPRFLEKRLRMKYYAISITDYTDPTLQNVIDGVDHVRRHTDRNEAVYVHCKAGKGRSASIVMGYLIAVKGMEPYAAQSAMLEARSQVDVDLYQRKVIVDFAARVKKLQDGLLEEHVSGEGKTKSAVEQPGGLDMELLEDGDSSSESEAASESEVIAD